MEEGYVEVTRKRYQEHSSTEAYSPLLCVERDLVAANSGGKRGKVTVPGGLFGEQ